MASFLIWIMFAGLLVLWLIDGRIKKEQALHAFLSALIAWVIAEMLKNLIPSVRPFKIYGNTPLTFTIPTDNSFPSSHAAATFAMAASIWLHDRRLGMVFVIGAILTCAGRVLASVHGSRGGDCLGCICCQASPGKSNCREEKIKLDN